MKPKSFLLVCLVLSLFVASSCGLRRRGSASYGDPDVSKTRASVPQGSAKESEPTAAAKGPVQPTGSTGAMVFTLKDQSGRSPEGIPIQVEGPISQTFRSDAKGVVRLDGPPGNYTFRTVTGCDDRIEVLAGTSGKFGIAAGQTANGNLAVEWRHRVAPSLPAYSDVNPYWPPGETVTVRFDVVDRCVPGGPSRVGGLEYPTFVFQPGANIKIVERPALKADRDGYGYVKVTCLREGPAELAVVDSKNPKERLSLVDSKGGFGGEGNSCKNI